MGADFFKVDADLSADGDGEETEPLRVREVESKILFEPTFQRGFSIWTVTEPEVVRRGIEVSSEDGPQDAARDDETVTISRESKSVSPRPFVQG